MERFVEGSLIVKEGADCQFVGYVLEGEINVEVASKGGGTKRARNIEAGEIFGRLGVY